jgi:hypothetical protein
VGRYYICTLGQMGTMEIKSNIPCPTPLIRFEPLRGNVGIKQVPAPGFNGQPSTWDLAKAVSD